MTKRMLPFMLLFVALITGACDVLIPYFISMEPLSIDGCTVDVTVPGRQLDDFAQFDIFVPDITYLFLIARSFPLDMRSLFDVGPDDKIYIQDKDMVRFEGTFHVRQFTYVKGKWYFNILPNGERAAFHSESFIGDTAEYDIKDIVDNNWLWVDGEFIDNFDALRLNCDETDEIIEVTQPAEESVSRMYMCRVDLIGTEIAGRVGPGLDRAIRAYIPRNNAGYGVSGKWVSDRGIEWYELDVPGLGFLWVLKSQTDSEDRDQGNTISPRIDCDDDIIPARYVPPILHSSTVSSANETGGFSCDGFALVSPLTIVPADVTTFEWTSVVDADGYIVMFYNYQGEFAAQLSAETNSINVNTGELPTGSALTWEVYALLDGETICRTHRSDTVIRQAYENAAETEEPDVSDDDDDDGKRRGGGGYTPPDEGDGGDEGDPPPDVDDGYTPPDGDGDPPPDEG